MTQVVDMTGNADRAAEIRSALTDQLRADGMITSAWVETAFRTVPREAFAPEGTPLEVVYNAADAVATKRDEHGVTISSISAPFIQARMLEQVGLGRGHRAVEYGSGGYNAALMAEVVGPEGMVSSVDIDPEVTDQAGALLDAAGYGHRVRVIRADAEHGVPDIGAVDRIIVTFGAWDLPPEMLAQLADDGVIVVPLRMNGITRSIGFHRVGDHLESTSAEVCGFVAAQGDGEHAERVFVLPDPDGQLVKLRFDVGAPSDPTLLDGVLAFEATEVWSGVTIPHGVSFADLNLWLAGYLPGFCQIAVDDGTDLAATRFKTWFPFGAAQGDSLTLMAVRPALEGAGVEFGARAYGPHADGVAAAMVEQIQAWDAQGRTEPTFAYWPTGADLTRIPADAAILMKTHGLVTISWPPAA